MDIFVFNPDTDFALAKGRATYTPPAKIMRMRRSMALTQLPLASEGDIILLPDPSDSLQDLPEEHVSLAKDRNVTIVNISELKNHLHGDFHISPWGWNHSFRRMMRNAGIPDNHLRSEEEIDTLRTLAHRRTTLPFRELIGEEHNYFRFPATIESADTEEAFEFSRSFDTVYCKAPWSSSGRGVMRSDALSESRLKEWIAGTIHRQGSVMIEEGLSKKVDFATEWWIDEADVRFLGFSMFEATPDGRYQGNRQSSQTEIYERLVSLLPTWNDVILAIQESALRQIIAPYYTGPVGIDMLGDMDNLINPCVEINLRQTMGIVALKRPLREMLSSGSVFPKESFSFRAGS